MQPSRLSAKTTAKYPTLNFTIDTVVSTNERQLRIRSEGPMKFFRNKLKFCKDSATNAQKTRILSPN